VTAAQEIIKYQLFHVKQGFYRCLRRLKTFCVQKVLKIPKNFNLSHQEIKLVSRETKTTAASAAILPAAVVY